MKQKIWKPIKGYEGLYEVSNIGKVRSLNYLHTGRVKELKAMKSTKGYSQVSLWKDGKPQIRLIHRLVAEAFIPNPERLPCVNHRDEVKTNNTVSNLEWCTKKYNNEYSGNIEKAIETTKKPIFQYTKNGEFLQEFESIMEAERLTGINNANISQCCLGKRKSAGGFIWKFK